MRGKKNRAPYNFTKLLDVDKNIEDQKVRVNIKINTSLINWPKEGELFLDGLFDHKVTHFLTYSF